MSGVWFVICIPTEVTEFQNEAKKDSDSDKYGKFNDSKEGIRKRSPSGSKGSSCGTFSTAHSVIDGENVKVNAEDPKVIKDEHFEKVHNASLNSSSGCGRETKSESDLLVDFVENEISMKRLLEETLNNLQITDTFWNLSLDRTLYQVSFLCESGSRSDVILRYLTSQGIGLHKGSTIGVIPCAMLYREIKPDEDEDACSFANQDGQSEYDDSIRDMKKESTGLRALQRDFLKSVTSRLTVAQVVEGVRSNASLTFDFAALIVFASIISAIGLVEDNSIILVASMLISPLMGPILAGTFGAVVQDRDLWLLGTRTEIIGLSSCILLGFLIGLIYTALHWSPELWPTAEMASRGQLKNLLSGAFIALPSGGGVALSILGGNVGSLVGVAISASLLPPAVNAGMLWGMAAVLSKYNFESPNANKADVNVTVPHEVYQSSASYKFVYSEEISKEFAVLGVVSLLLTIINIICIFIAAVFVLKIKEVAPNTNVPKTRRFWKQDIKIARDYNKSFRHGEALTFGKQVLEEWTKINGIGHKEFFSSPQVKQKELHRLKSVVEGVEADKVYQTVMKSMPGGHLVEPICRSLITWPDTELYTENRPSLWELNFPNFHEKPGENHLSRACASDRAKRYFRAKYMGLSFDSMSNYEPVDSVSDAEFHCRQVPNSSYLSTSGASSYNNFLHVNRMGLWTPFGASRGKSTRFVVTPVEEVETPSSHIRPKHKNLPSSVFDTVTTV